MDVVHSIRSINSYTKRGETMVEAKTVCGHELTRAQPRGAALVDIGLSGWSSEVTCEACKNPRGGPQE